MKALVLTDSKEPLQMVDVPMPQIGDGECLVRINSAGLNRRDQWIREGMYPGIKSGIVLGSDGCGVVEEGPGEWVGRDVIINPNVNWGGREKVQHSDYSVLGMPVDGTLAEYIKVPVDRLHPKPLHLDRNEAAALPLAAMTAYRALISKGKIKRGKSVLVTGAGGGVAQFAIAYGVAVSANVYVTSGTEEKIERSKEIGAIDGFDYHEEKWWKKTLDIGFDAIIDSAGGDQLNNYLKIVKPGGRIVVYGSTTGYPEKLDVFRLFWSQASIIGSTMASDEEFEKMLDFVRDYQIKPTIDQVVPFHDYIKAFDRFKDPDAMGKIVLHIED